MLNMLRSGEDSDVTIKCDGREWHAHVNILRAMSPVFKAQLSGTWKESQERLIEQEFFDATAMDQLLVWIYTGDYTASNDLKRRADDQFQSLDAESDAATSSKDTTLAAELEASVTTLLVEYIHVNSIADYYGITALADEAAKGFEKVLACASTIGNASEIIAELCEAGQPATKLQHMYNIKFVPKLIGDHPLKPGEVLRKASDMIGGYNYLCLLLQQFQTEYLAESARLLDQQEKTIRVESELASEKSSVEGLVKKLKSWEGRCNGRYCDLLLFNGHFEKIDGEQWSVRCQGCQYVNR